MPYNYKPLWQMLDKYGMNKTQFRERLGISTSTLAKLSANKPVSTDVLSKICEYFNCGLDSVATYASNIELFMISMEPDIVSWKYVLNSDGWPSFYFELTNQQVTYLRKIGKKNLTTIIYEFEQEANAMNFPNAGILGSTEYYLSSTEFRLKGSFAVVERLLPWIIEGAKSIL